MVVVVLGMNTGMIIAMQMVMILMMTVEKTTIPMAMVIMTFMMVVTMATVNTTIATPTILTI